MCVRRDGMGGITENVDNGDVFQEILRERTALVVLIYASWCPFCTKFLPVFKQYAKSNPQLCLMLQDDEEKMAVKYAVNIYPSILFFNNGTIAKRLDGIPGKGLQEEKFTQFIEQLEIPAQRGT
jgi:thioredoxin 1